MFCLNLRKYFFGNISTINISKEIKLSTGWLFTSQKSNDLYIWMLEKYGSDLNLSGEEGELLRTMDPESYFKFLKYYTTHEKIL
jgi:hypothetical protein|tara:strand:+ start:1421 stop:1672 length:252 start_codon:yes stop_codon:yes gene_type:complete